MTEGDEYFLFSCFFVIVENWNGSFRFLYYVESLLMPLIYGELTRIEILKISTGQENTLSFDGDPYWTAEYFHRIGKYSVENQLTGPSTEDG
jgi:hypothetical protein